MSEKLFDNYLLSIQERDIDLLLMEEFHVSPEFVFWFCNKLGLENVQSIGAWHSVSNNDGETDLLLVVQDNQCRVGILIENKVGASEQDEQDIRYHKRGNTAVKEGKFDKYRTVMCAPKGYIEGLPETSQYQHQITYEDIVGWYAQSNDPRSNWRRRILCEAIEQRRRGSVMIMNAQTTEFHRDFWKYLRTNHPSLLMNKPLAKGSKSNWIIVKKHTFPKGVNIHFKFDQQVVELGFQRHSVEDIEKASPELCDGIVINQKGKTAVLSLATPPIDVQKAVSLQTEAIEAAITAAFKLTPYSCLLTK